MGEHALRELIGDVKARRMSQRSFVRTMVGAGLPAPLAVQMLASAGVRPAHAQAPGPTQRGPDLSGWDTNMWRLPYWHRA